MFFSFFLLQQSQGSANSMFLVEMVLIIPILYFLIFLPQQRLKKKQQQMLNALKTGDIVVTSGGIMGTVTAVDGDTIVLRVKPDNLKLQFARSAVSTVVNPEGSK